MNKEQTVMICPRCGEIDGSCKDDYIHPHAKCIRCGCEMTPTEYNVSIIYKLLDGRPSDYEKFKHDLRKKYTINSDIFNKEKYQQLINNEQERINQHIVATDEDYNKEQERIQQYQKHLKFQNDLRCPKCNSSNVTTGQRGYSFLTGFLGSCKTMNRCGDCGYKWKPK